MKNLSKTFVLLFALLVFSSGEIIFAQPQLKIPDASQRATVSQQIGLSEISITYNRPGVKGRMVFGGLVPYGEVWRAGANENTVISFSSDVQINGKNLPAGKYGFHIIPTDKDWTLIFSKNYWSWGSFNYDQKEDALRITITPQKAEMQEWLQYTFDNVEANSTTVSLRWADMKASFNITVDVHKVVFDSFRKEFDNLAGFFWQPWNQAANYCLQNKVNMEEGLIWADRSISIVPNTQNQITKALLLEALGKNSEAEELKSKALGSGTEADINTVGYQFLQTGKVDEAIKVFEINTERFPDSWNAWDSLAEGYAAKGDKENAIKYYNKALEMSPENQHVRIRQALDNLK